MNVQPLDDIRIIALEQYGAGPFGSVHLAGLGADVIKIEDPDTGGDIARYVLPYAEGEDSLFFETYNLNKRSVCLDLRTAKGRDVFEDLVRHSDAVYSNLRGDVPTKLGLRYNDLKHVNPRIVCCSLTGFGSDGPRAADPAYDYVLQAMAGWMSVTGEPDGPPQKSGLSLVDFSGGFVAAISLLAGVHAARRDGTGMDCDLSLYDTALNLLGYVATWHLTAGYEPTRTRRSSHPSLVPFQLFRARDGWLVAGCAKEKFWVRLTRAIGQPDLAEDPRFASFAVRAEHRDELEEILDMAFSTRTVGDWLEILREAGVPCSPVHDVGQALRDEQAQARGMIIETEHPRFGTVRQVASPVRVGPRSGENARAPRLGEHTEAVLKDVLGYDAATIEDLSRQGAFGTWPPTSPTSHGPADVL